MDSLLSSFVKHQLAKKQQAKQQASVNEDSDSASENDDAQEEELKLKRTVTNRPQPKRPEPKAKTKTNDELFDQLQLPGVFIFLGKSKQGKSFLMRSLIKRWSMAGKFKAGLVFTTTKFNGGFNWMADQNCVITGYNENMLKRYLNKLSAYRTSHNDTPLPNFIIFDDIGRSVDWNDKLLSVLINTPRHFGTSIFICVQYAKGLILPNVREQADVAFIFQQKTNDSLEAAYTNFGSRLGTYDQFKSTLDDITSRDHHCLVMLTEPGNGNIQYREYCAPANEPNIVLKFGKKKEKEDENDNDNSNV